ncbi:hypothetical protein DCAR_0100764 [Daucus carota subsp. sativus]|uniref:Uncharacterized protein n=1 Tax=Daucus carota subsp. sativus TaxID=79200 RepID=A0AAF1AFW1_DAUCS|nr:hypothetical protein DCAR_0100764 [Daucus carota subsp. sativus]
MKIAHIIYRQEVKLVSCSSLIHPSHNFYLFIYYYFLPDIHLYQCHKDVRPESFQDRLQLVQECDATATNNKRIITLTLFVIYRTMSCFLFFKFFNCIIQVVLIFIFLGSTLSWWPYALAVLVIFTVVTMYAVVVTEGCRKIKLQYYGFKLASSSRQGEVEPYIPFNINPSGMQPILTTTYLLAVPSILAGLLGSPVWEYIKQMLNPETSTGAGPWVYYTIYSFFVFVFNIFDIVSVLTIEYLTKVQASTRFWGGLLLATLATTSSILDHYLRSINLGFSISFTSVLIIVGSIIELRRSYQAYNVMPSLSKALKRYGV